MVPGMQCSLALESLVLGKSGSVTADYVTLFSDLFSFLPFHSLPLPPSLPVVLLSSAQT